MRSSFTFILNHLATYINFVFPLNRFHTPLCGNGCKICLLTNRRSCEIYFYLCWTNLSLVDRTRNKNNGMGKSTTSCKCRQLGMWFCLTMPPFVLEFNCWVFLYQVSRFSVPRAGQSRVLGRHYFYAASYILPVPTPTPFLNGFEEVKEVAPEATKATKAPLGNPQEK